MNANTLPRMNAPRVNANLQRQFNNMTMNNNKSKKFWRNVAIFMAVLFFITMIIMLSKSSKYAYVDDESNKKC